MGNYTSSEDTVYSNLTKLREAYPDYYIHKYKDGHFVLTYNDTPEEYYTRVFIQEVEPTNESGKDVYLDYKNRAYKLIPNNIKEGVPFIDITQYSNNIYLGYLFSTNTRTGRFIESLMVDISKKLNAEGIHLVDASRGGKCNNISLSIQLFISETKSGQSYYEVLGYKRETTSGKDNVKLTKKLIEDAKKISMREFSKTITEMYNSNVPIDNLSSIIAFGYILSKEKHLDLNIFEYLNMLLEKGKCKQVEILLDSGYEFRIRNPVILSLRYLNNISFDYYYKALHKRRSN